ncbi:MAG TPA: stability/partitioning determinant [Polyangia bacterium]|nr:stability/partitioning determinant [Polyangia bacterium]
MAGERASIFDDKPELDLSAFAPKKKKDTAAPAAEAVRAVSETANFRSREAAPTHIAASSAKRPPRQFRTGRNVQFNAKALRETVDAIYAVSEAQGWVLGYTLERAIAALQRELESAT